MGRDSGASPAVGGESDVSDLGARVLLDEHDTFAWAPFCSEPGFNSRPWLPMCGSQRASGRAEAERVTNHIQ